MDVRVDVADLRQIQTELLVLGVFQGDGAAEGAVALVDGALGGSISELIGTGDVKGEMGQTVVLYTRGAIAPRRVMLIGLGKRAKLTLDQVRRVSAIAARAVRKLGVVRYCFGMLDGEPVGLGAEGVAQALVEGAILGAYTFVEHKTATEDLEPDLEELTLVLTSGDPAPAQRGAGDGQKIAESVALARDLVNQPANYLTPALLAEVAQEISSQLGLHCQVLGEAEMADLGMGALMAVAQGSDEPAQFIILEYNGERTDLDTYVVVGKGITFDSGGISIKPSDGMEAMKDDMAGAAVTLGVLRTVALLELPLRVIGLIPATENLPSGRAYKPGDVLTSMSGLTIEVISTDAEGRLILADALDYAKRYQPKGVVDLATLTGACVVALGHVTSGLMSNDQALVAALREASTLSGEKIWELPLDDEYAEQIKSDVADVKNTGGRPAGAITAGMFLGKFATAYPWAHLDIAGTAWSDKEKGYLVRGATGHGVRLLVQWLRDLASTK